MSKHESLVLKIEEILPHPDPETINLGIVKVFGEGGYQCVVNKNQWKVGDLAAYIEPDTMVDGNREEFSFLNGTKPPKKHRIKVKKLRGVWSEGFLIPVSGVEVGFDAWEMLGLERYEPTMIKRGNGRPAHLDADFGTGGGWVEAPVKLPFQKYDIENIRKYGKHFADHEDVVMMEKIHGANFRCVFANDKLYVGSQGGWRGEGKVSYTLPDGTVVEKEVSNTWLEGAKQNPWLEELCRAHPDKVFFGEVAGQVQDLKYGAGKNQIFVFLFDALSLTERKFLNWNEFNQIVKPEWMAPVLYVGPYSKEIVAEHTDGMSLVPNANHIREGLVVKPLIERDVYGLGRLILKSVSNNYLERP
jgi:RNA ligase (TIGR02306 family)